MRLADCSPRKRLSVNPNTLLREYLKRTRNSFAIPGLNRSRRKGILDRRKNQCDDGRSQHYA